MNGSYYRLQVIDTRTGTIARSWQAGDRVEIDLAEDLAMRLKAKGVGLLKTEAKVLTALREAMGEMMLDLKKRV